MSGRPLRFLGGTLALWTMGRVAFLLPSEPGVDVVRMTPRPAAKARAVTVVAVRQAMVQMPPIKRPMAPPVAITPPDGEAAEWAIPPTPEEIPEAVLPASSSRLAIPTLPPLPSPKDRWSASLWAVARQGGGALLPGGQLGGTQAGVRLLRRLDRHGDLSASLRVSAPWDGLGREMAVGLDWKPSRHLPLRLIVEQRVPLDTGRGGTALLAVAGYGPRTIAPGVTVTAYAQGGAAARGSVEPFADGAARISTSLTPVIDLGLGLWGGAQRDAQRLDVGPTLGIALPLADRRVRLSLDWRQRVAGRAVPDSGPALTLAGDF